MKADNYLDRLHESVETHRNRPLSWGEWDCCQFVAEIVLATTGTDHRGKFPPYQNEQQAQAILQARGGMHGLLTHAFGEAIPVAWAKRGDVLLIDAGNGPAAAICLGVHCAVVGPNGLEFRECKDATAAWRAD